MSDYENYTGLYLNTYIIDDFDGGSFNSGWNTDFTNNWPINQWPTGDYVAVKNTSGENIFISGPISGSFDFQMGLRLGPTFTGNHSEHFYIRNYNDDTLYAKLGRNSAGDALEFDNTVTTDTTAWIYSQYSTKYVRLMRGYNLVDNKPVSNGDNDTLYAYYSTDNENWTAFSINATTGSGADFYLTIDGAEDVGILNITLQADSGMPYFNPYIIVETGPEDTIVFAGDTANFDVGITGTGDYLVNWYKVNSDTGITGSIAGATGLSYTTTTLTVLDDGDGYFAKFDYPITGSPEYYTNLATLGVTSALGIVDQPQDQTKIENQTATFDVGATGYDLSYQWYKIDTNTGITGSISGAVSNSYITSPLTLSDSGDGYFVSLSETGSGTIYSDIANSYVYNIISQQPSNKSIYNGGNATFSLGVTGNPDYYQWYYRETNGVTGTISGATGLTYTTDTKTLSDDGEYYWATVTKGYITEYSNRVKLSVSSVLGFITGPQDIIVDEGYTGLYEGSATGYNINYQWYKINEYGNTGAISGATGSTYVVGPVDTDSDNNSYTLCITETDNSNVICSPKAGLTVRESLKVLSQNEVYITEQGTEARFWVVTSGGTQPYSYEWYRSDDGITFTGPIQGATGSTYIAEDVSVTGIGADNGDLFYCKVTDSA